MQEDAGQRAGPEADGLGKAPGSPLHEIAEQVESHRDEHEQTDSTSQNRVDRRRTELMHPKGDARTELAHCRTAFRESPWRESQFVIFHTRRRRDG
jgi:hypothetical protein